MKVIKSKTQVLKLEEEREREKKNKSISLKSIDKCYQTINERKQ